MILAVVFGFLGIFGAPLAFSMGGAPSQDLPELQTVSFVDVEQYQGKWFEIASFPQSFQKGCTATSAEYGLNPDGTLSVLNSCRLNSPKGELKLAKGRARIVDAQTNAKLKVSFFWPFEGDYWIIDLAPDYSFVVVGAPGRNYLWILAREKQLPAYLYTEILERLIQNGFDVSKLVKTIH